MFHLRILFLSFLVVLFASHSGAGLFALTSGLVQHASSFFLRSVRECIGMATLPVLYCRYVRFVWPFVWWSGWYYIFECGYVKYFLSSFCSTFCNRTVLRKSRD